MGHGSWANGQETEKAHEWLSHGMGRRVQRKWVLGGKNSSKQRCGLPEILPERGGNNNFCTVFLSFLGWCTTTGQTSWTMHDTIGQRASRTQTTHVQEWSRWQGKSHRDRPRWHPDLHPQRHWKTPSKAQRSNWGTKIEFWNRFIHWHMIITRELSMTKDLLIWQMQSVVFWTRTKETVWWRLILIFFKKTPPK